MPSGASTGIYEALELRDNDKTRYMGKGKTTPWSFLFFCYYFSSTLYSVVCLHLLLLLFQFLHLSSSLLGVKRAVKYVNEFLAPALCNQVNKVWNNRMTLLQMHDECVCLWKLILAGKCSQT